SAGRQYINPAYLQFFIEPFQMLACDLYHEVAITGGRERRRRGAGRRARGALDLAIEDMIADVDRLFELLSPARGDVMGMVECGVSGEVAHISAFDERCNPKGAIPGDHICRLIRLAVTGEGKLAGVAAMAAFKDNLAIALGSVQHAVVDNLC